MKTQKSKASGCSQMPYLFATLIEAFHYLFAVACFLGSHAFVIQYVFLIFSLHLVNTCVSVH